MGGSQIHLEVLGFKRLVKMRNAWYSDLFVLGGYFCSFSYLDSFLLESLSSFQFSETVQITPQFLGIFNINFTSVRSYVLRSKMHYKVRMCILSKTGRGKEHLTAKYDN